MTIIEKINQLEALTSKADLEVEYAIQVRWLTGAEQDKNDIRVINQNARELFATGRLNMLDYDIVQATYDNYNKRLDAYLTMFPEYSLDFENSSQKRHI